MIRGFTVENRILNMLGYPIEDSYSIDLDKRILAVADGVTRDPAKYYPAENLPCKIIGGLRFILDYPKPSPAKIVADIFTKTFPIVLKNFDKIDKKAIKEAFNESNKEIMKWNEKNIPDPDYLTRDLAGCVASGVHKEKDYIAFGYLTDCGVAIFDEAGNLRFKTENEGPEKYDKHIWQDERLKNLNWSNPDARRIIRMYYRNNPAEKHSFGVLTGEDNAICYVRTGIEEIKPNEYLIVYSDGLEQIIFSGDFVDLLRKQDIIRLREFCRNKVKTEGTLILSKSFVS